MNRRERRALRTGKGASAPRPLNGQLATRPAPASTKPDVVIVTGIDGDDQTFTGEILGMFRTWNVSRLQRDCLAGRHGQPFLFDVTAAYHSNRNVETEADKVARFMNLPEVLALPLIVVMVAGRAWLVEGHHRLRALYRLGHAEFAAWVVEEADIGRYLVLFNGQSAMPWKGGAA